MPVVTLHFKDYRLENVCRATSVEQRAEAVAFWLTQGVLANRREGERRAFELVQLVRRRDGTLAGMSTAALKTAADERCYYVFRMFLRKEDRVPYLMRTVTNATRDVLRVLGDPVHQPAGMLIVTENRKLMRPGLRRYFHRHGYVFQGQTASGLDMWLAPFGDASLRIREKQPAA